MKLTPESLASLVYSVLKIAVVAYALLAVVILLFQEHLIFHPAPSQGYRFEREFEQHWVALEDRTKVNSLLFKMPNAKGTILFFHGNAGSLTDWGHVAATMAAQTGWNVWIIDYPGFGESEGKIRSENQLHRMAKTFLDHARANLGASETFIALGRSIGSGIATRLAMENSLPGLILETPYLSLKSLAGLIFPWAPMFLVRYPFRSDLWLPQIKAPILILHGDQDEVIPFAQGQALAQLQSAAKFVTVPGANHNDLGSHEVYWAEIKSFLNRL